MLLRSVLIYDFASNIVGNVGDQMNCLFRFINTNYFLTLHNTLGINNVLTKNEDSLRS